MSGTGQLTAPVDRCCRQGACCDRPARTICGSLYMRCTRAAWNTRSSSGVLKTCATSSRLHPPRWALKQQAYTWGQVPASE